MNRAAVWFVVLMTVLTAACASGDDAGSSPTGPSSPTPPAAAPPAPGTNNSCAPSQPANFTMAISGTSLRVFSWSASTGAADYFIQIGSVSGASDLIYTNTTHTDYTWNGAGPGTYYARVHARNSCGSSAPSPELVVH